MDNQFDPAKGILARNEGFVCKRAALTVVMKLLSITGQSSGEKTMAYFEKSREILKGPITPELLRLRAEAGWQVASIEWQRELPGDAPIDSQAGEIPYGLRIAEDFKRLEIDPEEHTILMQMMELLVQDFPFSSVASDLNEKGCRTREGRRWNAVSVFNMMPRLVEAGPTIFSSADWEARRHHFIKAI